ncbi:hypothetical protein OSB04_017046 [Centaurea solstitialis]|uniref:DUF4283 domain-containing protein n=1 Tax=Centaurea solstitialis TaxID=347529 RepID=A0AA38TD71_9ASTR|nr:hypothetical protein OSB04_017046 [Centaurea solstitialis]
MAKTNSYAAVVGSSQSSSLEFFAPPNKDSRVVSIPVEMAKATAKSFHTTIYGYFLGSRIHFPIIERYVSSVWAKYGFKDAMMNDNGIFFFRFNDVGGCSQVVEFGPLMIRGVPLFVYHWDPTKGVKKQDHTTCPLWVKLHNVPLVAFNTEGISRIVSLLGMPRKMDSCTSAMCDNLWGRPGFAKVLIDVWVTGDLKRSIDVVIPDLKGNGDCTVQVNVEYIWEPSQCSFCKVFGHKSTACTKRPITTKPQRAPEVDKEGLTLVTKKKWVPTTNIKTSVVEGSEKQMEKGEVSGSGVSGTPILKDSTQKNKTDERVKDMGKNLDCTSTRSDKGKGINVEESQSRNFTPVPNPIPLMR